MAIDLKAIRAAAEAAPQDRLHVRHDFGAYYSLRHYPGDYYQGRIRGKERAEFIATANPSTILELLDRLEAAEKGAARYRWMRSPITSYKAVTAMVNAVDSLCEEQMDEAIDALMKDEQK